MGYVVPACVACAIPCSVAAAFVDWCQNNGFVHIQSRFWLLQKLRRKAYKTSPLMQRLPRMNPDHSCPMPSRSHWLFLVLVPIIGVVEGHVAFADGELHSSSPMPSSPPGTGRPAATIPTLF